LVKGAFMGFKKIIVGFMIFILVHFDAGYAQEEISDEDLEAIQILDILENLDLLEENLDLLDTMTEIGDENEL
jgi:hypothetical protein